MGNIWAKIKKIEFSRLGIFIAFIAVFIVFSIANKHFLTRSNILTILRQTSFTGMLALGLSFSIITAGIDLSVASITCFAGLIAAHYSISRASDHLPLAIAILLGVAVAATFGFVNGWFTANGKLPAFIVTLATQIAFRGMCFIYTDGRPIVGMSNEFNVVGQGDFLHIAIPIWVFVATIIFATIVLHYSKFGRHIYAVGGNAAAAEASGIDVAKVKLLCYVISGTIAGISGIVLTSRLNAGSPVTGQGSELDAIAAAVMGGTSLAGGRGRVLGMVVGVLLIGIIANGLDIMNITSYYQQVVKGAIIIIAVFLDRKSVAW